MKLAGVPSSGFTKMMSFGLRRGVSIARNATGPSIMSGRAWMVPRLDIRQNVAGAIACDQRAQAELSMTRQKFVRSKLLSLSAKTSSLTVPNVLSGRCFIPL